MSHSITAAVVSLALLLPPALTHAQPRRSAPGEYSGYSTATYDGYRRESRHVAMRDGIRLAVDLYRPTRQGVVHEERLPVVWTHHRYNRAFMRGDTLIDYINGFGAGVDRLLRHGYVVAAVDARGAGASMGTQQGFFMPDEARDAYEITEWLAAQSWSTGRVGMIGRSYLGITQLFAASQAPPHLKAIFPEMYVFEWYPFIYPGGVFRDDFFTQWQRLTKGLDSGARFTWGPLRFDGVAPVDGPDGRLLRDSAIAAHRVNRDMLEMWRGVPYRDSRDSISGKPIHQERGPATYLAQINASGVAVYGLAGWFDAFPRDALLWHENLTVPRKLVMGPWFHGETTGFDLATERLRWFDHWLKGIDNGIMREPPIRYFVIDAPAGEQWRTARRWPIAEARATVFHFGARSRGETPNANALARVREAAGVDTLRVDTTATVGPATRWAATYGGPGGYPDLAANDAKGLTYTTEALAAPVEVIGHPVVHLWVASSAGDVDAIVYLEDVAPDGRSTYVTEGVLRASHRRLATPPYRNFGLPWPRSHAADVRVLPMVPTELQFDLLPTAKRFKAGHRIRITVQGADRDTHVRVTHGAPTVLVYRDARHPSRIVLPVVR
ncbi:MAG: CocE/NonD family hydrolase [Gemmatimonadetes bacterium]|nr:CocE/NonD family hydrolase [Gemmatimonadota bacterium]